MPSPKDGTQVTPDDPAEPEKAAAADESTPGGLPAAEGGSHTRKGPPAGSTQADAADAGGADGASSDEPVAWISFDLKDNHGNPVPDEPYELTLPDGTIRTGTLDEKGKARVDGIPPGQCQINFPRLHKAEWRKA